MSLLARPVGFSLGGGVGGACVCAPDKPSDKVTKHHKLPESFPPKHNPPHLDNNPLTPPTPRGKGN